ncbi:MAG: site-specific integrase [Cyclobacteriaceae bacterium]
MRNENLTTKAYLNERKPHKDGGKIFYRLLCGSKGPDRKAEIYTGFGCSSGNWDKAKQRAIKGNLKDEINRKISSLEAEAYKAKGVLEYEGKVVTGKAIKRVMLGEFEFDKVLVEYFAQHISEMEERKNDFEDGTVKTYKTSIIHLKNYLNYSKQKGITLKKIDYKFISGYDHYLRTQVRNNRLKLIHNNTVVKQHTKLRTLMIKAVKEGIVSFNPYRDFKLCIIERKVVALSREELDNIIKLKLPERLDRVRDVFIFSCYSGLRFSDASSLTMDKLEKGQDERFYLRLKAQKKTGEPLYVPLTKVAQEILEKYRDSNERKVLNLALPKITNQKLNAYLKEIALIADIDKNLTHKLARHTFATTVLAGFPRYVKKELLGHKDIKSTSIYDDVLEEELRAC